MRTGIYSMKKIPWQEIYDVLLNTEPFPVHKHWGVSLQDATVQSKDASKNQCDVVLWGA